MALVIAQLSIDKKKNILLKRFEASFGGSLFLGVLCTHMHTHTNPPPPKSSTPQIEERIWVLFLFFNLVFSFSTLFLSDLSLSFSFVNTMT